MQAQDGVDNPSGEMTQARFERLAPHSGHDWHLSEAPSAGSWKLWGKRMRDYPDNMRFDTEKGITDALLFLLSRGVAEDHLEETLVQCGPVDLDLLAQIMRAFQPDGETHGDIAPQAGNANAA